MTVTHQDRTGALIMRKLRSAAPEGTTRYELREALPPPLKPSFPAAFDDLLSAHLVRQKPKTPGYFQLAIEIDKERAKKGILNKLERATRPVPKQELKDNLHRDIRHLFFVAVAELVDDGLVEERLAPPRKGPNWARFFVLISSNDRREAVAA